MNIVDLTGTPAALEYVTEELGHSQAPVVVVVDDGFHWSGPGTRRHRPRHRPRGPRDAS